VNDIYDMNVISTIFLFYVGHVVSLIALYGLPMICALLVFLYLVTRLRTKRFYFIRHGQTVLNEMQVKQDSTGSLNEKGIIQAKITGKYLRQFGIQKIYASPYIRAVETARVINQYLNVPLVYTPLLVERRNPSDIIGKSFFDTEVKKVIDLIDLSYHSDNFRYLDEENFDDLKKRAHRCLRFLGSRFPLQVAVVTHGVFLKMMLAYMVHQGSLHNSAYIRLSYFNTADNGGITVCEYVPWKKWFTATKGWKILIYNQNLT
jgi:broad specificity phosphatase PhoE